MTLKENVLKEIDTAKNRQIIALSMGLTENAIRQYIHRNDVKLTQYAPLQEIKKIMNVSTIHDLLNEIELVNG